MAYLMLIVFLSFLQTSMQFPRGNKDLNEWTWKLDEPVEYGNNGDTTGNLGTMDIITNINQANDLTNLYEGDISLQGEVPKSNDPSLEAEEVSNFIEAKRDAVRNREYLWQSKVVPYEIASALENFVYTIEGVLAEISSKTCIKFVKRTTEANWIYFVRRAGCWSSVGKLYTRPGPQEISLSNGCLMHSTILHEVLHSLGIWHEQSRPDRDQFIEIFWENIQQGQESNFEKYSHQEADMLGIEYDYSSVMHYGSKAFSKNGKETIKPIRQATANLGGAEGLSKLDAIQLNALYDCKNTETLGWSSWSTFSPCNENCFKYRQRFCSHTNKTLCQGANEYGVQKETVECVKDATECYAPINGHWGRWGAWSSCSTSCDIGVQQRTRKCTDPAPKYDGKNCDGSETGSQSCKIKSCDLGEDDCEFDNDLFCHWTNDYSNEEGYDWQRLSGTTPSRNTGPTGDHTSNNGHYLYLEASSPAESGYKGRLASKLFTDGKPKCLSFYYHMYGSNIGALRVFFEGAQTKTKVLIWQKVGDQGNIWKEGMATLVPEENYKVVFEGERAGGYKGDIAIDDVKFLAGPCPDETPDPGVTTTASPPTGTLPKTTPQPYYIKQIGCYKDKGLICGKRPFPQYVSYRQQIDWKNMSKTVTDCAYKAKELNYEFFAVEFYGECWYGPLDQVQYARDGLSDDCWNGVGKGHAMMVYQWSTRSN